jgi:hypothetical protein
MILTKGLGWRTCSFSTVVTGDLTAWLRSRPGVEFAIPSGPKLEVVRLTHV